MFKKFFMLSVALLMFASSSFAVESTLWTSHITRTCLVDNTGDFFTAWFDQVDITINADEDGGTGTITFPDGGFTLIGDNDSIIDTVAKGTSKTLTLKWNGDEYKVADSNGTIVTFVGGANENLAGQKVTWSFPEGSTVTGGNAAIPSFKSTASQMSETGAVPNIELIINGDNVTGVKYWIAKASDPDTKITLSYKTDFRLGYNTTEGISKKSDWQKDKTSGEYTFEEPIPLSKVRFIYARLRIHEDDNNPCIYTWRFYPQDDHLAILWSSHISNAELVDGASDFTNASFSELQISLSDIKLEGIETGNITITNGGYSVKYSSNNEKVVEEVAKGTSRTFALKKKTDFVPATESGEDGKVLAFINDADTNFAGQPVFWTLADNYGAAKFPKFKTMNEQLSEAVPFIETITDSNGKISGVKYSVVKVVNNNTEVTNLTYKTDFRFGYKLKNSERKKYDWQNDKTSGEYMFDESVALSDLEYIFVRLRTHENNSGSPIYTWQFYTTDTDPDDHDYEPESKDNNISGNSSSGCNSGFGILGLALIAFIAVKLRK